MRLIAANAAVALSVCLSVCLLVRTVSCAKTAESIEMPFGLVQGTVYYTEARISPGETQFFRGEGSIFGPIVKYSEYPA